MAVQNVAEFFGLLGLKVDKAAWKRGNDQIAGMKQAVVGLGAYFGGRALGKALVGFNANLETTKIQIASMLALAKGSKLSDELATAGQVMASLAKQAVKLPGSAAEYANLLGAVTQSATRAGLSVKELEDLSIAAVLAGKAVGQSWEVASLDVKQALAGTVGAKDQVAGVALASIGYADEAGRARFNALSARKRATELKRAFDQPVWRQSAEAQSNTLAGGWDTFKASLEQALGRVGVPLFKALSAALREVNAWLERNSATIEAVATAIGGVLVGAFDLLGDAFAFLTNGSDEATAILIGIGAAIAAFVIPPLIAMAAAWVAALAPIIAIVAAVALVVLAIRKVIKHSDKIKRAFRAVWDWVADKALDAWTFIVDKALWVETSIKSVASAIRKAFSDAFAWIEAKAFSMAAAIANTPLIKQVLELGGVSFDTIGDDDRSAFDAYLKNVAKKGDFAMTMEDWERAGRPKGSGAKTPPVAPSVRTPAASASSGGPSVNVGGVHVGGITVVAAPGMDEAQLANKAGEVFEKKMAETWQRIGFNNGGTR